MLSTFLLGVGCGEDVLVGSLPLRIVSDAGADGSDEVDAGPNPQGDSAQAAREDACRKHDEHCDEKKH